MVFAMNVMCACNVFCMCVIRQLLAKYQEQKETKLHLKLTESEERKALGRVKGSPGLSQYHFWETSC